MTEFHAQPYNGYFTGFYFKSTEEFDTNSNRLAKAGCDEFEIQVIDGEDHLLDLTKAAEISQSLITFWYESLENLDEHEAKQVKVLLDLGYDLESAFEKYEDVALFEGTLEDYAHECLHDLSKVPEYLKSYIDYEKFGRDLKLGGDVVEVEHDLLFVNANTL